MNLNCEFCVLLQLCFTQIMWTNYELLKYLYESVQVCQCCTGSPVV